MSKKQQDIFANKPTAENWAKCSDDERAFLIKWSKQKQTKPQFIRLAERIFIFQKISEITDEQLFGLEALAKVTSLLKYPHGRQGDQPDITAIIRGDQKTFTINYQPGKFELVDKKLNYFKGQFEIVDESDGKILLENTRQLYKQFSAIEKITLNDGSRSKVYYLADAGILFNLPEIPRFILPSFLDLGTFSGFRDIWVNQSVKEVVNMLGQGLDVDLDEGGSCFRVFVHKRLPYAIKWFNPLREGGENDFEALRSLEKDYPNALPSSYVIHCRDKQWLVVQEKLQPINKTKIPYDNDSDYWKFRQDFKGVSHEVGLTASGQPVIYDTEDLDPID